MGDHNRNPNRNLGRANTLSLADPVGTTLPTTHRQSWYGLKPSGSDLLDSFSHYGAGPNASSTLFKTTPKAGLSLPCPDVPTGPKTSVTRRQANTLEKPSSQPPVLEKQSSQTLFLKKRSPEKLPTLPKTSREHAVSRMATVLSADRAKIANTRQPIEANAS